MNAQKINLAELEKQLIEKWPSAVIARSEVGAFSGGLVTPGTQANIDSEGDGPERFNLSGRKVGYLAADYARWLVRRIAKAATPPNPHERKRRAVQ